MLPGGPRSWNAAANKREGDRCVAGVQASVPPAHSSGLSGCAMTARTNACFPCALTTRPRSVLLGDAAPQAGFLDRLSRAAQRRGHHASDGPGGHGYLVGAPFRPTSRPDAGRSSKVKPPYRRAAAVSGADAAYARDVVGGVPGQRPVAGELGGRDAVQCPHLGGASQPTARAPGDVQHPHRAPAPARRCG